MNERLLYISSKETDSLMSSNSWRCPYCQHHGAITNERRYFRRLLQDIPSAEGDSVVFDVIAVICPNNECKKMSLTFLMRTYIGTHSSVAPGASTNIKTGTELRRWEVLPNADMKVLPDYVPLAIRQDYEEACTIAKLSPKASATLARRALQGMIRDFWKVTDKKNLYQEVEAIRDRVDPDTWDAIDAVRSIGNIGAHMEKDVDLIVDVEPDEAALLLHLIEDLIDDWYVDRFERQQRLGKIKQLAEAKKMERKAGES